MAFNKNLIISILLHTIIFFITQPNLSSCEEIDIKIFGITVGKAQADSFTPGQKIGYQVLEYILSGLVSLAVVLVLVCVCCCVYCCGRKRKSNVERNVNMRSEGSNEEYGLDNEIEGDGENEETKENENRENW